jgi:prophage regulatory protein
MAATILRYSSNPPPSVRSETGLPRSSLYAQIKAGLFTRPVSLGPRTAGWPAHEVAALNAARIAGKSDDEIRALVRKLESARASAS